MYKVDIISSEDKNWVTGTRYILTKREAKRFLKHAKEDRCKFTYAKLVHCGGVVFTWSTYEAFTECLFD